MIFTIEKRGVVATTYALSRHGKRITTRQHLDHTAKVMAALPVYRANVETQTATPSKGVAG